MSLRTSFLAGTAAAMFALPAMACESHDLIKSTQTETPLQMLQSASEMDHSAHDMHAMSEGPMMVMDAYARSSRPGAPTGAAFMHIKNTSDVADRLIDVRSDVAQRVELHTHIDNGEGVMRMVHVEEGFEVAPGEVLMLARGGKHVMFMGLTESFLQGGMVPVTLVFENAGEVEVMIPVDLKRMPDEGHGAHGHMTHGNDS